VDPDAFERAENIATVFHPRDTLPQRKWDLVQEFIDREIDRRIDLLIADGEGGDRNRGFIEALRFVKDIPAREFERAIQAIGDSE
jgi:hypothetical protein